MHNIGSTWMAKPEVLLKLSKYAVFASMYIFNQGFNATTYPEVAKYLEGPLGTLGDWPNWYRLVSSMYGGDMAMNHVIGKVSKENRPPNTLDINSHFHEPIGNFKHIHAFHGLFSFNKHDFSAKVKKICNTFSISEKWDVIEKALNDSNLISLETPVSTYSEMISYRGAIYYLLSRKCSNRLTEQNSQQKQPSDYSPT